MTSDKDEPSSSTTPPQRSITRVLRDGGRAVISALFGKEALADHWDSLSAEVDDILEYPAYVLSSLSQKEFYTVTQAAGLQETKRVKGDYAFRSRLGKQVAAKLGLTSITVRAEKLVMID